MKVDQEVFGLKGGVKVFCPEHSVGDYHGKDVETGVEDASMQNTVNPK